MIEKLKLELKNLIEIRESIENSNDVGISVKQYINPLLENDINILKYRILNLENIQFFNNN